MNEYQEKEINTEHLSASSSYIICNKYDRNSCNLSNQQQNYTDDAVTNTNHIRDSSFVPNILGKTMPTDQQRKQIDLNRLNTSKNDQDLYNGQINNRIGTIDNVKCSNQPIGTQYNTYVYRRNNVTNTNGYTNRFTNFCDDAVATTTKHNAANCSQFTSTMNAGYCAEKATFVRPLVSYNQEFIYKTMKKNQRLQNIVKQLGVARQKERKSNAWKNFINELKSKHGHKDIGDMSTEQIDTFLRTNYQEKQSKSCKIFLNEIYQQNTQRNIDGAYSSLNHGCEDGSRYFNCQCYPMSSQGRFSMLNREKLRKPLYLNRDYRPLTRNIYGSTIIVGKEPNMKKEHNNLLPAKELLRNSSIQTNHTLLPPPTNDVGSNCEVQVSYSSKEKIKTTSEKTKYEQKRKSLSHLESKIDALIKTINTLIIEVKATTVGDKNVKLKAVSHKSSSFSDRINKTKSDTYEMHKHRKKIGSLVADKQSSYIISTGSNNSARNYSKEIVNDMNKIIIEEADKSQKVKSYLEDILTAQLKNPYAVKVIDIPTKERSTEGTDLIRIGNTNNKSAVKDVSTALSRITTAVNTDPLGILALLRVSSETLKQLLAYMPNIYNILPYHSYLSILQGPRLQINKASHYICNICGAAFRKPSQLTDHINGHNLGKARDCCVCRHYLDAQSQSCRGLIACRYCGQRFTRAYCCDLHEQSCATRLGRRHDVDSRHILLK